MANFCMERALKDNATSYYSLRKWFIPIKSKWNYSIHFFHSARRAATPMLKSWRLRGRIIAKGDKLIAKKLFIQLYHQLVKYEGIGSGFRLVRGVSSR